MPKKTSSKPAAKPAVTLSDFDKSVLALLRKSPKSTGTIAAELGLTGDDGKPTHYGRTKVLAAIKRLKGHRKAVQTGAFRTAAYAKA